MNRLYDWFGYIKVKIPQKGLQCALINFNDILLPTELNVSLDMLAAIKLINLVQSIILYFFISFVSLVVPGIHNVLLRKCFLRHELRLFVCKLTLSFGVYSDVFGRLFLGYLVHPYVVESVKLLLLTLLLEEQLLF